MKKLLKVVKIIQKLNLSVNNTQKRKLIKLVLWGTVFLLAASIILLLMLINLFINNYEQIYNWFSKALRYIFGESTVGLRKYIQLIIDSIIYNLLQP